VEGLGAAEECEVLADALGHDLDLLLPALAEVHRGELEEDLRDGVDGRAVVGIVAEKRDDLLRCGDRSLLLRRDAGEVRRVGELEVQRVAVGGVRYCWERGGEEGGGGERGGKGGEVGIVVWYGMWCGMCVVHVCGMGCYIERRMVRMIIR
jgi:hypothetical protein